MLLCGFVWGKATAAASVADAVFLGRVTMIRLVGARGNPTPNEFVYDGELEVSLEVDRAWKAVTSATVEVLTDAQATACGYPFLVGQYYLVYATQRASTRALETGLCSRTKELQAASADISALGPPTYEPTRSKQP